MTLAFASSMKERGSTVAAGSSKALWAPSDDRFEIRPAGHVATAWDAPRPCAAVARSCGPAILMSAVLR